MQVRRGSVQELRIGKFPISVLARTGLIGCKCAVSFVVPDECGAGGSAGGEIEVVVEICRVGHRCSEVVDGEGLCTRVHNVVLEHVVGGVVLNLKFAAARVLAVIFVQGVVDDSDMVAAPDLAGVTTNGNSRGVAEVNEVVARSHVGGVPAGVLAGHFDADVDIVNQVALDQDVRAPVDVNPVGAPAVFGIGRISVRTDVVNGIEGDGAVAGLIIRGIGRDAFKANSVDADVVVVVDQVVGNGEGIDVAVDREGLAAARLQVVDLIAADGDVVQRGRCLRPVESDAQRVGIAARCCRHNVVDVVVKQLQIASGAGDPDPDRNLASGSGFVVADFQSLDDHVALAGNVDQAALGGRCESGAVDNRGLAGIVLEGDVAGCSGAGGRNGHYFVVGSTQYLDSISRGDVIGGVLNVAPGTGRGQAVIVVAARGGHVVSGSGGEWGRQENAEPYNQ